MARQPIEEKYRAAERYFDRIESERYLDRCASEDEFDRLLREHGGFLPFLGVFMVWVVIVRGSRRLGRWVREMTRSPEPLRLPRPLLALPYSPGLQCPLDAPPSEPDERP